MKILGIDTTTKFLCLGLCDGKNIYAYNLDLGTKHSTLLIPTVKRILDALGWDIKEIDYFACGLGPGSFTGIRVGVAAVKGLSWAAGKPIIGIPTLDILANKLKTPQTTIAPVIDAKRGLIYTSVYKRNNGSLKRAAPYMLLNEDDLCRRIKPNTILLGDALSIYKEKITKNIRGAVILDKDYWYPDGHNIIELALEKARAKKFNTAFDVEPIYLYPKECQIRKR